MDRAELGRVALVTGASKGLGKALVQRLVDQGWTVVGMARNTEALHALEESLGTDCFIPYRCDVADSEQVCSVSTSLQQRGITPTLFFLNAGIAGEAACEDLQTFHLAKHKEIMATNYYGVLAWVEQWLPIVGEGEDTTFMVTSSINAQFAPPQGSAYAASKAAISKAFEGLSLKYVDTNVTFSVVYAGPIATDGLKGALPFAWSADRMAAYMINKALKKRRRCANSLYYSLLARLLSRMPPKLSRRFI